MNRIILAYAPENASLAANIDRSLSRIGIPFEHANAAIAAQLKAAGEPVLLLVTDNFLTNRAGLDGLLPVLQQLVAERKLVVVLADGINEAGEVVETHIDRMANALHYMKYWQDAWLTLSDLHQNAEGAEKSNLTAELDATRFIANQMGDLIGLLRENGYQTLQQFEANDYEAFFQKFNLQDWHGQYKRLVAQVAEDEALVAAPHLPEMPIFGGILAPEPLEDEFLAAAEQEHTSAPEPTIDTPITESAPLETQEAEEPTQNPSGDMEVSVQDAWFWIEKGHAQRGLDLFQTTLEQYPNSAWLQSEYERAVQQTAPKVELHVLPQSDPAPTPAPPVGQTDEAKSYELMGDMAAARGDYLFAKYCWDRVVEMDPDYPNIYRKLGLMTAEHLRDYRETAAIYLRKALETAPDDKELKAALQDETASKKDIQVSQPLVEQPVSSPPVVPVIVEPDPLPTEPNLPNTTVAPLVLITGATSGIGRATAEIFARNGYRLILTGRRVERLVEIKNRFEEAYGTEILLLPFDVRDSGAVEAALSNLPEAFQDIDILVNNAGLAKGLAPIHEGNLEHWETMIDTNVKGLLYVSRLVTPGMVRRRSGHVINVGSSASKEAYPNGNVYCATKFAVDALTKSMRFDLHVHNIRVSQVSPGHVEETEFAITRFDGDAERARIYNDFQPLKSSDVADAIYFMATRPPHVNIQDIQLFATQQASSMVVDRSGR
jgi:NADP-dependent 3-hydroxy acid dehydrogenase YdfG